MRNLVIAFAAAVALSGCWPWGHGKPPQQQYAEALMHGNAMAASQIWLNMSPEDRLKFSRGEGVSPDSSQAEEAKRQIMNHYADEAAAPENTETEQQTIRTPLGQSLQNLPELQGGSTAPPPMQNGD